MRLNLGCGDNRLPPPWQNHDADVDITKPLPWPDDSARFIVIEHCVEHVDYYQAVEFFKEAYRVLRIGGVLRVTVPSLTQIMNSGNQKYFDWLHGKGWAPTANDRGAMHAILYCHGHRTAWNSLLMESTLYYAGFRSPHKQRLGWSSHPELRGVEGHAKVIGEEFNAIESVTFEAAKMTGDLSRDYDAGFFAMHRAWRYEYDGIADALVRHLPEFHSAVDLGCGNGYVISALERLGKEVIGYDGSSATLEYRSDIVVTDITEPLNILLKHDLVICTEVAEHVEERLADALVDNVCRASRHMIFFSAAQAGHGGHLHVNEQPRSYWVNKFAERGFEVDRQATENIAASLRATNKNTWWFALNCFVLRRAGSQMALDFNREPVTATGPMKRRVAVVVGGSQRVWDDVARAVALCREHKLTPEYYVTNDMIEHFRHPAVACTLHPDKLAKWLAERAAKDRPMPSEVWSHDGGSGRDHPHVTHRLKDWGGSVGMFAYVVAREHGHDKVLLCGVPMNADNHFVRQSSWSAVSAFTRAWQSRRDEMLPHARSLSGGLTEELFGSPTEEWLLAESIT